MKNEKLGIGKDAATRQQRIFSREWTLRNAAWVQAAGTLKSQDTGVVNKRGKRCTENKPDSPAVRRSATRVGNGAANRTSGTRNLGLVVLAGKAPTKIKVESKYRPPNQAGQNPSCFIHKSVLRAHFPGHPAAKCRTLAGDPCSVLSTPSQTPGGHQPPPAAKLPGQGRGAGGT